MNRITGSSGGLPEGADARAESQGLRAIEHLDTTEPEPTWNVGGLRGRPPESSHRGSQGHPEEGKGPPRLTALVSQDVGLVVLDLATSQGNQDSAGQRSIRGAGPGA